MKHLPLYNYINIPNLLTSSDGKLILTNNNQTILLGRKIIELNQFALHGNFLKLHLIYPDYNINNLRISWLNYPYCLTQQIPFQELKPDLTIWSEQYNRLVLKSSFSENGKWSGIRHNLLKFKYLGWPEGDTYTI